MLTLLIFRYLSNNLKVLCKEYFLNNKLNAYRFKVLTQWQSLHSYEINSLYK